MKRSEINRYKRRQRKFQARIGKPQLPLAVKWLAMVTTAALVVFILTACGDNETEVTPRYWTCDAGTTCAGDSTCQVAWGHPYCTTSCAVQADCDQYLWPAVCVQGVCFGECWPMDPGGEDLAFCRQYGYLCPSDCHAQGLVCDAITGAFYPNYGCVLE